MGIWNDKSEVTDVIVRWQKTDGTDFIQLIGGSVEILPVEGEDSVVEIRIIEHLKATLDQEANAIEFVTDMAERWRLVGHSQPIPDINVFQEEGGVFHRHLDRLVQLLR